MVSNNIGNTLKKYTMVIALVIVIGIFYVGTGGTILLSQNVNNLLSQNAYVFVLGTGMLLCILTGGNIDLSVGSVVCFVGGIGAMLMDKKVNVWVAVIVMLLVGILVGAWQAFWVAYVNVPPFIATLAGMYAFRGLSNVVLNGYAVSISNKTFLNVFGGGADCYIPDFFHGPKLNITCIVAGVITVVIYAFLSIRKRALASKKGYDTTSALGFYAKLAIISAVIIFLAYKLAGYKGIPTSLLWIILIVLVYNYVTTKTTIGRYLYAVGGNEKATQLSGINTKKVYFFAYTNMGFLAAFAGILTVARAASAQPTYGQFYEMDAIGACFIGGASAYGGTGSVFGAIVGALLMGVINQGMLIMGVDANYQKVVKGLVLLAAVIFDVMSKREKK
ncbi:multiple monosaccharide ABC transporter permease [Pseudobutyrivibrio xylanivorans]|uniref:Xylose transport system permease protein XylH n=1 Tax=Pseudobutyrivibrio xylanivorans DSM 14809 TaxID=1123012 RepID=A0A1M6G9H3_PSEXY|nr:multiple monosaccharide ABC transporter permease [Pseudobutyrivibrio xylanivorans]SHJ06569.1 putative multiple sugar transport system permease protein [Pseudobutyrivibrio xylanivorans DSM 14809]